MDETVHKTYDIGAVPEYFLENRAANRESLFGFSHSSDKTAC